MLSRARVRGLPPAFGSLACATCSSSLALAPAGSGTVCLLSAAVAAIPGGSGACLSHFTAIRSHQKVVGLRPPLKGLNARPLCLAAAACTALLVAASPASRHPPRLCAVMQKQNPVRQCCHRAPPCVACGFFATRIGRPRGGAVDKLRPRRGVRCEKHNTKTANVSG